MPASARSLSRDLPVFLSAAFRQPRATGAIAPSSQPLARVLASVVPPFGSPTVVELGAGTGSVSAAIDTRLPKAGRHLAVEINGDLVEHLRRTRPNLRVLQGNAAELSSLLANVGVSRVDAVVSGLPWSLFDESLQRRILSEVTRVLRPGGAFTTLAYRHAAVLPGSRRFRALLDEHFDLVMASRTVWANLPPAAVYVCHALRPAAGPHR